MNIQFNQQKLEKLLTDFYNCTNLSVSIFDNEFNCIAYSPTTQKFCDCMRENESGQKKCLQTDKQHFEQAKQTRQTVIYTCHAGLVESVTPIFYDNIAIAYVILGRFRDKEQIYSSAEKMLNSQKPTVFSNEKWLQLYKQIPEISQDTVKSALSLLKMCIEHIWNAHLIKMDRNLLATQIETYILENITTNISIASICKQFYISKQTLYTIFHAEYNDTVKNYILTKRLSMAKKLLTTTNAPISDIATKVGFSDYNYFIRLFKAKTGITPLVFRKTQLKG